MTEPRLDPVMAKDVAPRAKASNYPPLFAQRLNGRIKRQLGEVFGISSFGANLTTLPPGAQSALMHRHDCQEEFIFILTGNPTLRTDHGEYQLEPGMCMGFPANGLAHHLVNRTDNDVDYLEVGNRVAGDGADYPEDDLQATWSDGSWSYTRKDGSPLEEAE